MKTKSKIKLDYIFLILFFLTGFTFLNAQNIKINGVVKDSLEKSIQNANILAFPLNKDKNTKFTITNQDGRYELLLEKGNKYKIQISSLGFKNYNFELIVSNNEEKNIILSQTKISLNEVIIFKKQPITIKEDTLTYKVSAFTTGEERKLKDILKKLPGIEVDKEGNVTSNGKKISKILVEGKPFFSGKSKLAVNNIPANAVDEIDVLGNYSAIEMFKGLDNIDDTAINIKLKEEKKKFVFGDINFGSGIGINQNYCINPLLFYYSTKTNVNFIADVNDNGIKSFTFKDYIDFEGGSRRFKDTKSIIDLYNDDFNSFLVNKDFKKSINKFGAINISQSLNSKLRFSFYCIINNEINQFQNNNTNNYLINNISLTENRTENEDKFNTFGLGKILLEYKPNTNTDISTSTYFRCSKSRGNAITKSFFNGISNNSIEESENISNLNFKQEIDFNKKFNKKNIVSFNMNFNFNRINPESNYITEKEIFVGLLRLVNEGNNYKIKKNSNTQFVEYNFLLKHYWLINNHNHLYTSIGSLFSFSKYSDIQFQELNNNLINDFNDLGFNNDLSYNFKDTFFELEYKFKKGIMTFAPSILVNNYSWNTIQFGSYQITNKVLFLPNLIVKLELNKSETINLNYSLKPSFASIRQLASGYTINSFNSIYKGNQEIDNAISHNIKINYFRSNLFRKIYYNFGVNYIKKNIAIGNKVEFEGINQYSTPFAFDNKEEVVFLNANFSKGIKRVKVSFESFYRINSYLQPVGDLFIKNTSSSFNIGFKFETNFKKSPNIEIGYNKIFNNYKNASLTSNFINENPYIEINYDFLKCFVFKANYNYDIYKNDTRNLLTTFQNLSASLFYQKTNNPWGFEINATNIFDTEFKQENSFSNTIITDNKTYVLPKIILLKISYKI